MLAWGRNARVTVPPRFKASGSHAVSYKRATAVECLVRPGRPYRSLLCWASERRRAAALPRLGVGVRLYSEPRCAQKESAAAM